MRIDATAAIKRLGIRHPVRFVAADMTKPNGQRTITGGVWPDDPTTVYIDPVAMQWAFDTYGMTPEETIAHELVHVAQMQEAGSPEEANAAYVREHLLHGYKDNRFEREADELAPWLAPLVQVTP